MEGFSGSPWLECNSLISCSFDCLGSWGLVMIGSLSLSTGKSTAIKCDVSAFWCTPSEIIQEVPSDNELYVTIPARVHS